MNTNELEKVVSDLSVSNAQHEIRLDKLEEDMTGVKSQVDDIHRIATAVEVITHDTTETKEQLKSFRNEVKEDTTELKQRLVAVENAPMKTTYNLVKEIGKKLAWIVIGALAIILLGILFPNVPWK